VPLPTAAADHQTANARALESSGAAVHVPQAALTADRLDTLVRDLLAAPERLARMAEAGTRRARPGAAEDIARRVLAVVTSRK